MENHNTRYNNLSFLKARRKTLRNNCTTAETILWEYIKQSKLHGRKFRRQHSVGSYILDFYCPSEYLAIELDGRIHDTPEQITYDQKRTAFLERLGIQVIRFRNEELFECPKKVLADIAQSFR